jgi:hypothetical protein
MFKRQVVDKSVVFGCRVGVGAAASFFLMIYLWYQYGLIVPRVLLGVGGIATVLGILYIALLCKPSK